MGWLSLGVGGSSAIALAQQFFRSTDTPLPSLQGFSFETVTVNEQGEETDRRSGQAQFFAEDLGNGITLEMVQIPGGTFTMGSPESEKDWDDNESPQHQVTVPAFFMGKFAVTQAEYEAIMGNNPASFKGANRPVEQVSWNEAIEFCEKLSQQTGRTYRLPSEAEWEYACRAGTTTPFHFGMTMTSDLANYQGTLSINLNLLENTANELRMWAVFHPMPLDFMTCTAMCGNGVRMFGMRITTVRQRTEVLG